MILTIDPLPKDFSKAKPGEKPNIATQTPQTATTVNSAEIRIRACNSQVSKEVLIQGPILKD